ncbi:MAG TPA: NAD-dependent dehydratase [Pusillimonas sp.]|jgi:UDP-glucuronate decarboxylase|nr:NAD-dependent dehydratase [Pusillimonas sp.]|tara:strand:+ start:50574 stop:51557 length:984 start_codon:yes stop_codon:yes gene_type:complete
MANLKNNEQIILVTGGAGFLGIHLCQQLLAQGHRVICLDNFKTGSHENIVPLMQNRRFSLVTQDIIDPLPADIRPTQIYNLACPASPVHYQADPIHTLRTCIQGAFNVLERASACAARVLQASTSEVYGNPEVHPQPEHYHGNVNPIGLRACYDEGKRCAETLFSDYARTRSTSVRIARIFNTYGPGMSPNDGRAISNFVVQGLSGRPLTIYGNGSQTRSLCYVDDLITGLICLMNSNNATEEPLNLGNTEEISIVEIARQVCALLGRDPMLEFLPLPADDPILRCPDTTRAKQVLGWQPTVTFSEGLGKTIASFSRSSQFVGGHFP